MEVPPADILTYTSPKNDAALTFVNSTTVNGVLLKNGQAWDVVASDGFLKVIGSANYITLDGAGREDGIGGSAV